METGEQNLSQALDEALKILAEHRAEKKAVEVSKQTAEEIALTHMLENWVREFEGYLKCEEGKKILLLLKKLNSCIAVFSRDHGHHIQTQLFLDKLGFCKRYKSGYEYINIHQSPEEFCKEWYLHADLAELIPTIQKKAQELVEVILKKK